ncbi:peptidoglycan-binding protein [Streptomyces werraensis]|uniref:peptidoglycan-binding protein n=1 Tax=Streptomyces werraensis TaxID=68284 RepID=UPI0037007359
MSTQAAKVLSIAKGEVGTKETYSAGHWVNNSKYNRWFGKIPGYSQDGYGWPWCAAFVAWVADEAGVEDLYPRSASCSYGVAWFKNKGRWSEYPAIGAQVFFGSGGGTHTGIVVAYTADTVTTVEGNTNTNNSPEGDGVYKRTHNRRNPYVYGYGLPKFSEGITTADPSKKGKSGFHYAEKASAPVGASTSKPAPSKVKVVTVKAGQTLGLIAASAGISLAALLGTNPGITNPDVVHPGDKVTLPADAPTPKATPKPSTPAKPKPTAKPKAAPKFPGAKYFKPGAKNSYVTQLGKALVKKGYGRFYKVGPGPEWGTADYNAVKAFQKAQGWKGSAADGYPGPETWARLMK